MAEEPRSILEFLQQTENGGKKKRQAKNGIKYPEPQNPVWIDKEGKGHPVSLMETRHIYSVLRVFDRYNMTGENIEQWRRVFNRELDRRMKEGGAP